MPTTVAAFPRAGDGGPSASTSRMRIGFHTLGCRLNEAETERWVAQFRHRGFAIAARGEAADLIVVNTCAVTAEAVRKSRSLLRRSQRSSPSAKLILSGCLATLEAEALAAAPGIDLLVPNRDKDRLVEIAVARLGLESETNATAVDLATSLFCRGRQRAFIKVQDGCRHRCTFCVVSRARGEERSRPIAELRDEVARLVSAGVHEVVLTGVHLGGYGHDGDRDLAALIRTLLEETAVERIRIGALEPWDLPAGLFDLFANPRLMPHLHLPLQSGSDRVLRRMARRGTSKSFAQLVDEARRTVPDLNLTTDIIVGFPGESDADWAETLALIATIGPGDLHVFAYSPRPGTPAAAWPDRVPEPIKRERCGQLRELGQRCRQATLSGFVGRRMPVLIEASVAVSAAGDWLGYTPNYLPVRISPADGAPAPVNRILDVSLTDLHPDGRALIGQAPRPASAAFSGGAAGVSAAQ